MNLWLTLFARLLSTALLLTTSLSAEPNPERHLYLLIGQSNMAGRAPLEPGDHTPLDRCFLLNNDDEWEPARNPLNRHSSIRKKLSLQKLGPGYSFAQTLLKKDPDLSLGLIVNAKGGTSIKLWQKDTPFYNEAVRRTREAQKSGTLKGILWHQGEGDQRRSRSYLKELATLIADLRTDLHAPDVPFIAGQIYHHPEHKPRSLTLNKELLKLPTLVPHTACVPSQGLTTLDHTHFDNASAKKLGQRYATAILKLQKQPRSTSNP